MAAEDVLGRCRRNHNGVAFHRIVETVEVALKYKTHRIEVFESAARFGYNLLSLQDVEEGDYSVWSLTRFTKAEYTSSDAALSAALNSLGYRT